MGKLKKDIRTLTKFSLSLNIVFICGTIFFTYKFYPKLKSKTYKNLYFVSNEKLVGQDHEATIDGIHFNDLGHYRAYERLL